jgi:hypothetical protein
MGGNQVAVRGDLHENAPLLFVMAIIYCSSTASTRFPTSTLLRVVMDSTSVHSRAEPRVGLIVESSSCPSASLRFFSAREPRAAR